jgi:hypothetical protein
MTRARKGHRVRALNINEYIVRRGKDGVMNWRVPKHLWVWDEPPLKRYPKKPNPPPDEPREDVKPPPDGPPDAESDP